MATYRDLLVWQRSLDLAHAVYSVTQCFPRSELYGLVSQMQRAAVSIAATIAKGHDRDSTKEFLRHRSFSLGSLAELETLLAVAARLNYVEESAMRALTEDCQSIGRMLRALQLALRERIRQQDPNP